MSNCPAAWEELMGLLAPVVLADTFAFEGEDHVDDGYPTQAYEWDLL